MKITQPLVLTIGQIAGIGGFSLGVLLLIFRDVIQKNIFPNLTQSQSYRVIRLILLLTFAIATLGIAAWVYVSHRDPGPVIEGFYKSPPKLISPENDSKLSTFPRKIEYSWQPVIGAATYHLDVEYFDGSSNEWKPLPVNTGKIKTTFTKAETGFPGAQPGRWRITAANELNEKGQSSEWRTFFYQQ